MLSKLPEDLTETLKEYLHKGEKIHDALEEVYVLNFDFRWILLTNERIILATKRFFDYNFKDYVLDSLDMDIDLGFFFDQIEIRIPAKNYTAHFYRFNRYNNLKFYHEIEKKVREQKEGGKEEVEDTSKPENKLRELKRLYEEGVITEEEYQDKRKEQLKKI